MSKYSINDTTLDNIAAPIMSMRGLTGGLTPEEMGTNANAVLVNVTDALNAIAAKGVDITGMNSDDLAALIGLISGTEDLTAELEAQDAIITELEEAVASKAAGSAEPPNIQPLTVTENGTYTVSGDVDGYSPVTVNVPEKKPVLQELTVTENGIYPVPETADGYGTVTVNVPTSGGSSVGDKFRTVADGTVAEITAEDLSGVTVLRKYAFYGCTNLSSLTLPEGLITISDYALQNAESLTSLVIPASVTGLGLRSLEIGTTENKATITFLPTTPPSVRSSTFIVDKLEKIIVPKGCGSAYKSAFTWSTNFVDYIVESET